MGPKSEKLPGSMYEIIPDLATKVARKEIELSDAIRIIADICGPRWTRQLEEMGIPTTQNNDRG